MYTLSNPVLKKQRKRRRMGVYDHSLLPSDNTSGYTRRQNKTETVPPAGQKACFTFSILSSVILHALYVMHLHNISSTQRVNHRTHTIHPLTHTQELF